MDGKTLELLYDNKGVLKIGDIEDFIPQWKALAQKNQGTKLKIKFVNEEAYSILGLIWNGHEFIVDIKTGSPTKHGMKLWKKGYVVREEIISNFLRTRIKYFSKRKLFIKTFLMQRI